jgi:hypothetical protein
MEKFKMTAADDATLQAFELVYTNVNLSTIKPVSAPQVRPRPAAALNETLAKIVLRWPYVRSPTVAFHDGARPR